MKLNDRPGTREEDDDLDRIQFAKSIAEEILLFDNSEGCVVAVTGPWGSGKSTLPHFMEPYLRDSGKGYVVWFNPWFFSSADDLVERFFQQLSIVFDMEPKLKHIAASADDLGTALTPMKELSSIALPVGLLPSIAKIPKKVLDVWQGGVEKQKAKLADALRRAEMNVYFVIDDIDRLTSQEVREIAKLVRLTGSLPRVTYILAYDRHRVEEALSDSGLSGREYLEKIVFASYDVPRIHKSHVGIVLESGLNDLLARSKLPDELDQSRAYQVMNEVLLSRITNLRNAKRFVASCGPAISQLAQDVDVLDLLCLELLRMFDPDVFKVLLEEYPLLSWYQDDNRFFAPDRDQRVKGAVEAVLSVKDDQVTKWILKNMYPMSWQRYDEQFFPPQNPAQLSRDRRVAHEHFMTLYAARFEDRGIVARRRAEETLEKTSSTESLDRYLGSLEIDEVADIADVLTEMTAAIPDAGTVPLSVSLLTQSRREGARQRYFSDFGVAQPAQTIITRLIDRTANQSRQATVDEIYGGVGSFESKLRVVKIAQSQDSNGNPFLPPDQLEVLKERLAGDFKAADSGQLSGERWLLFLATEIMETCHVSQIDLPDFLATADVAWAFLRSSVQQSHNTRAGEPHYTMDVHAVDSVLGGRQRTLDLIQICESHPGDNKDDKRYVMAAAQTVNQANAIESQ